VCVCLCIAGALQLASLIERCLLFRNTKTFEGPCLSATRRSAPLRFEAFGQQHFNPQGTRIFARLSYLYKCALHTEKEYSHGTNQTGKFPSSSSQRYSSMRWPSFFHIHPNIPRLEYLGLAPVLARPDRRSNQGFYTPVFFPKVILCLQSAQIL
jgi:hypothetical protein